MKYAKDPGGKLAETAKWLEGMAIDDEFRRDGDTDHAVMVPRSSLRWLAKYIRRQVRAYEAKIEGDA